MNETKGLLPRTQALIEEPGYEANSEPDIIYSGVDYPIGSNQWRIYTRAYPGIGPG